MSSERKVKISHLHSNEVESHPEAGYKIQTFLALQAYRRQKQENAELKFNIKTLSDKVDALQLQRYALRQLLEAEKTRLAIINNDVHKILNNLEEFRQEKNLLLKEREQLQDRIKALEERIVGMENEYQNQRNDLMTAKMEARSWEKQLEREREKLSKMKSEKKLSVEDVQEVAEESKESAGANNRKVPREARIKSTACRTTKKNTGRGREIGKIDPP